MVTNSEGNVLIPYAYNEYL